uniref:Uncharacterized protein n=1 Tax=Romanomermis culicivorax TaxID=13658 RepID=A0A915L6J8_ROMCU
MPLILIMRRENGKGFSQSVRKEYLYAVAIVTFVCVLTMNYNLNSITGQRYVMVTESTPNHSVSHFVDQPAANATRPDSNVQTVDKACHFPDLDPWHPSLADFITNETVRVSCPQTQANLTYIDTQGFLIFNESQFEEFVYWLNVKAEDEENATLPFSVNCFYWTFDRAPGLDDNNVFRIVKTFQNCNFYVSDTTDEKVYWNIHAHPANKSDRIFNSPTDTQLSVLLLGIDSLSYSMFRRRMPLTNDYIVNNMGMHMFKTLFED